jgi:hypothetical protein
MVFDTFNQANAKYYNPWEHLAVNKERLNLKAESLSSNIFPKKVKVLESEFVDCVMTQDVFMTWQCRLAKEGEPATGNMMVIHSTVRDLTHKM